MAHDVFISFSSKDKPIADAVCATLEGAGIRCWIAPRDIRPGDDWGKAISSAIKASKIFILIFSGNANRSQRVLDEVNFAISCGLVIVPFRIENLEPTDAMMLHLSTRHWLDAYDPSWDKYLTQLAQTVSAVLKPDKLLEEKETGAKKEPPRKKLGGMTKYLFIGVMVILAGALATYFLARGRQMNTPPSATSIMPVLTATATATATALPATETMPSATSTAAAEGILNIPFASDTVEFDPQMWLDENSDTLAQNLFLPLTRLDFSQGTILPAAAASWTVSSDGKIYTFKLRDDIPWVTHAINGKTEPVTDDNGTPRNLIAQDFVDAIKRICSNNAISRNRGINPVIKGCQAASAYADPSKVPVDVLNNIGARAISSDELLIELENPCAYFLTVTSMNYMAGLPIWAIDKYGQAWKNPGVMPTDGYYVVNDFHLGESIQLVRNSYLPPDLFGGGNIGTINISLGKSLPAAYDLWKNAKVDIAEIPIDLVKNHVNTYPDQYLETTGGIEILFKFNVQVQPFDNVHVRRALAAALDKTTFIEGVLKGEGRPIDHFGLPGLVGAPPLNGIGVGFDPTFARSELALAGYPDCKGFPKITIPINSSHMRELGFPDEYARAWEQALGCPANTITINSNASANNDGMKILGWGIDFPDEDNMLSFLLTCTSPGDKSCDQNDSLIFQARTEINPENRSALYAQIEQAFFGKDGSFPVMPFFMITRPYAISTWVKAGFFSTSLGPASFNTWSVSGK